jgi:hypothetical protein
VSEPTGPQLLPDPAERPGRGRATLFTVAAVAVTGAILAAALLLGAWGFNFRRHAQHEARLSRLLQRKPTLEQVDAAFQAEGTARLAAPANADALERDATTWGRARREQILAKSRQWTTTRVYLAGDMVYFVFFDEQNILRDFACVGKPPRPVSAR